MRSRIVVVGLCTVVGLWLAPVAQAKAKARDKSPAAPSSVTYPYGSFVANSTCQSSGGVTCQGSSASVDPANGAATLVAKVSGTNGAATATEQGVLQTRLGLPASKPQATLAVTFTLRAPFTNGETLDGQQASLL